MTEKCFEIRCINKSDSTSPNECSRGIDGDDPRVVLSEEEAIAGIETGRWKLYVSEEGELISVLVGLGKNGKKFLKTEKGEAPTRLVKVRRCV